MKKQGFPGGGGEICSCYYDYLLMKKIVSNAKKNSVEEKAAKDVKNGTTVLWVQYAAAL